MFSTTAITRSSVGTSHDPLAFMSLRNSGDPSSGRRFECPDSDGYRVADDMRGQSALMLPGCSFVGYLRAFFDDAVP